MDGDFGADVTSGLSNGQVELLRDIQIIGFYALFFEALEDAILLVLIAAATASLVGFIVEASEVGLSGVM